GAQRDVVAAAGDDDLGAARRRLGEELQRARDGGERAVARLRAGAVHVGAVDRIDVPGVVGDRVAAVGRADAGGAVRRIGAGAGAAHAAGGRAAAVARLAGAAE